MPDIHPDDSAIIIGRNIRNLRAKKGVSATDCAQKMGVSQTYWSKWENGRRRPGAVYMQRLAALFDVTTEALEDANVTGGVVRKCETCARLFEKLAKLRKALSKANKDIQEMSDWIREADWAEVEEARDRGCDDLTLQRMIENIEHKSYPSPVIPEE